jgi:hypothetical protein
MIFVDAGEARVHKNHYGSNILCGALHAPHKILEPYLLFYCRVNSSRPKVKKIKIAQAIKTLIRLETLRLCPNRSLTNRLIELVRVLKLAGRLDFMGTPPPQNQVLNQTLVRDEK